MTNERIPASFRDPSGFLFKRGGMIYRQVNQSYQRDYDQLMGSGLYQELTEKKLLIPHSEVKIEPAEKELAYKVLQPESLDFISYPYEWSFSQLKDAALLTLEIQKRAIGRGMSLKDSSAYNIQFHRQGCRPVLIDTLSFEAYQEGKPWDAYRQYCQHFLAPLALMAYTDIRLSQLLRVYIDGVPLDLASKLLPRKTRRNFGLLSHIHLHAAAQERYSDKSVDKEAVPRQMTKTQFLGLIDSLERTTQKLTWQEGGTEWGAYYEDTNYSDQAMQHKQTLAAEFLDHIQPKTVWDLGGNTGIFSRIASKRDILTLSFDIDPTAVEINYREVKKNKEDHLIPLVLDLTNPSPSLGWDNQERQSIGQRGSADAILALALIHHLAISNNVPLPQAAEYFASLGKWLVIEFVPKSDSQVKRLLATRKDIFPNYTPEGFETAFSQVYKTVRKEHIEGSQRMLYLMEKR